MPPCPSSKACLLLKKLDERVAVVDLRTPPDAMEGGILLATYIAFIVAAIVHALQWAGRGRSAEERERTSASSHAQRTRAKASEDFLLRVLP